MTLCTERYLVRVTAEQALVHSEGAMGNIVSFRRQKWALATGRVIQIPIISGNAARNRLRHAAMWHMLRYIGLLDEGAPKLGKRALNLLFSGGSLDSEAKAVLVGEYRELLHLIPPLSLFGGGIGNALIPGCLRVDAMIPICEETTRLAAAPIPAEILPEGYTPHPIAEYTDTFQGTRKELFHDPKMVRLLSDGERQSTEAKVAKGRKEREDGKHPDKADTQQMIYSYECLAPGTLLAWRVGIEQATEMERDCFLTTLALFAANAQVAGHAATGFGRIKLEAKGLQLAPSQMSDLPGFPVGRAYEQMLATRAEEVRAWLLKRD